MSLPSEYTEYKYLQSSGTQYIDLGFRFSSTPTRVVIDFQFLSSDNNRWVFGDFGKGGIEAGIYSNQLYTGYFTYSNTSVTSRGIGTSTWYTSTSMTGNEWLFARNYDNVSDRGYVSAKVFSLKIETEDETLMNLVPAMRNSDAVLGMYDTVSGTFFVNQGSGTFTGEPKEGGIGINVEKSGFLLVAEKGSQPYTEATEKTSYFAFYPLVSGMVYTVTVLTPDIALRAGTFASIPNAAGITGLRTVCKPKTDPPASFTFSFTAKATEAYLVLYAGTIEDGASGLGVVEIESSPFNHIYDSVEEIIEAGTKYMTTRISSANDDTTVSVPGVSPTWLKYNGVIPTTIYTSGNTWIGMGSQTEDIKFNRRDTKMYYFYTEEGLLYNHYRFLKMRWVGYSRYNETGSSYYQSWEVIFFETGDLMIHAVNIPSSSCDGSFNIVASQTYSYTKPTSASPYVSFYSQDENNSIFNISYDIIDIPLPFNKRWLIKDEGVLYNITDGVLTPLEITEITAANMLEYGNDTPPNGSLLLGLTSPTVYHWNDSTEEEFEPTQPTIATVLTANPFTQTLEVHVDMSHDSITGILCATAQYSGDVVVKYSLDDGITYSENYPIADFLNLDFSEIYGNLPQDKILYLRFSLVTDSTLTNLQFTFTNT